MSNSTTNTCDLCGSAFPATDSVVLRGKESSSGIFVVGTIEFKVNDNATTRPARLCLNCKLAHLNAWFKEFAQHG